MTSDRASRATLDKPAKRILYPVARTIQILLSFEATLACPHFRGLRDRGRDPPRNRSDLNEASACSATSNGRSISRVNWKFSFFSLLPSLPSHVRPVASLRSSGFVFLSFSSEEAFMERTLRRVSGCRLRDTDGFLHYFPRREHRFAIDRDTRVRISRSERHSRRL